MFNTLEDFIEEFKTYSIEEMLEIKKECCVDTGEPELDELIEGFLESLTDEDIMNSK